MRKYFYHFVMKYRGRKIPDDFSRFADDIYKDHAFPKHSYDYHEISTYLELNGGDLSTFDKIWEEYELEGY